MESTLNVPGKQQIHIWGFANMKVEGEWGGVGNAFIMSRGEGELKVTSPPRNIPQGKPSHISCFWKADKKLKYFFCIFFFSNRYIQIDFLCTKNNAIKMCNFYDIDLIPSRRGIYLYDAPLPLTQLIRGEIIYFTFGAN